MTYLLLPLSTTLAATAAATGDENGHKEQANGQADLQRQEVIDAGDTGL